MIAPRETIIAAILAKLVTLTTFQKISRQWETFDTAATLDDLDALFLIEQPEKHTKQGRKMPAKIDFAFDIVLVIKNPEDATPGSAINPLLDKLDGLFMPTQLEQMTGGAELGGLVEEVWIEGTIQKNYSFLAGSASIAVIPLHVRSTNPR